MLRLASIALAFAAALLVQTDRAAAHGEHKPVPLPITRSVKIIADNGGRVDVLVGLEFVNPEKEPITVTGITGLGGAKPMLVDASGAAFTLVIPAGETVTLTPPGRGLLIKNASKAALTGVGLLITFSTDTAGDLQLLVDAE